MITCHGKNATDPKLTSKMHVKPTYDPAAWGAKCTTIYFVIEKHRLASKSSPTLTSIAAS
jgi:hypothetical protein